MLLYQQIRNYVQTLVDNNQLSETGKLPSERELQEYFSSTRITVREALLHLEAEGVIYSQKRRGWFVTPRPLRWNPANKVNFYQLAKEQGLIAKTNVHDLKKITSDNTVSQEFGDKKLFHLSRIRYLDGRAVMFEDIFCQQKKFRNLNSQQLDGSITEIMQQHYQIDINSEQSLIRVTVLPDSIASLLDKNSGSPCLKIIRQRFDKNNNLVDYNIEYWLHNSIEMIIEGQ